MARADEPRRQLADSRLVSDKRDASLARVFLQVSEDRGTPSAINSALISCEVRTAPITPGSRCENGRIALYMCVALRAPCAMAIRACS